MQSRHHAIDGRELNFALVVKARNRVQQSTRIGMSGLIEYVKDGALLHHLAGVHDDYGITSLDKAKVRDSIESTSNFVGVDGIFNMSPEDHMGLGLDSFKMLEISGGDWKFLY